MDASSNMLLDAKIETLLCEKKAVAATIRRLETKIADWFFDTQRVHFMKLKKKTLDVLVREDGLHLLNSPCGWKTATPIQKMAANGYINVCLVMQESSEVIRIYLSDYKQELKNRDNIILALRELGVELPVMHIPICNGDNTALKSCVFSFHCENGEVRPSVG